MGALVQAGEAAGARRMSTPALEVNGLKKRFGGLPATRDVSLARVNATDCQWRRASQVIRDDSVDAGRDVQRVTNERDIARIFRNE